MNHGEVANDDAGPAREAVYRKVLGRLMPFLMVCYLFAYIDRSNIGLAKLGFMHELGFDEAVYGLAGGFFYLGYTLFSVPSNLMVARIGVRKSLLRMMCAWGIFSAALALVSSPIEFYVLRFLVGAAEAAFLPGVLLFLSRWAPQSRRARFNAFFLAAIPISGVVGGPLGALILSQTDGLGGWAGWRWLFVVEGLPAAILGVVAWRYLRERPQDAPWLDEAEKAQIAADIDAESRDRAGHARHGSTWRALLDRRFLALAPMSVAAIAGSAAIGLWFPSMLRAAGVADATWVALLTTLPYAVAIAAQYLVARSSDRTGERRWHSAGPVLVAALAWLLVPQASHNVPLLLGLMTIIAMGTFAVTGPFWSMPTALLSGTAAAAGIATISTCGGLGAFFAPAIVGMLAKSQSFDAGAWFYAGLLAAGALALLAGTAGKQPA